MLCYRRDNNEVKFRFSKKATKFRGTKAVTKQEGPKKFLAAPKMVSFSQLPAVKKDTIFGAARKKFGPSFFVTALEGGSLCLQMFSSP